MKFWLNFTCTKVTKYLISGAQPKSSMGSGWSPWKEGPIGVVSECSRDTIFSRLMAVAPYLYLSTVFLLLLGLMYRLNELLAGHSAQQSFVAFHADWARFWFQTTPRKAYSAYGALCVWGLDPYFCKRAWNDMNRQSSSEYEVVFVFAGCGLVHDWYIYDHI